MNSALYQNKLVFRRVILAIPLHVLADRHSLFDQKVEILGELRGKTVGLQNSENFVTSHIRHLTDPVSVTKQNTDLRGGETLLGEFADMFVDLLGGEL